jgi:hypothetical protein
MKEFADYADLGTSGGIAVAASRLGLPGQSASRERTRDAQAQRRAVSVKPTGVALAWWRRRRDRDLQVRPLGGALHLT